jgi:hypothetical protein
MDGRREHCRAEVPTKAAARQDLTSVRSDRTTGAQLRAHPNTSPSPHPPTDPPPTHPLPPTHGPFHRPIDMRHEKVSGHWHERDVYFLFDKTPWKLLLKKGNLFKNPQSLDQNTQRHKKKEPHEKCVPTCQPSSSNRSFWVLGLVRRAFVICWFVASFLAHWNVLPFHSCRTMLWRSRKDSPNPGHLVSKEHPDVSVAFAFLFQSFGSFASWTVRTNLYVSCQTDHPILFQRFVEHLRF